MHVHIGLFIYLFNQKDAQINAASLIQCLSAINESIWLLANPFQDFLPGSSTLQPISSPLLFSRNPRISPW